MRILVFILLLIPSGLFAQEDSLFYTLEIEQEGPDLTMVIVACTKNEVHFSYLEYDGQRDVYHPIRSFQTKLQSQKLLKLFADASDSLQVYEMEIYAMDEDFTASQYTLTDERKPWMSPTVEGTYVRYLDAVLQELQLYIDPDAFPHALR